MDLEEDLGEDLDRGSGCRIWWRICVEDHKVDLEEDLGEDLDEDLDGGSGGGSGWRIWKWIWRKIWGRIWRRIWMGDLEEDLDWSASKGWRGELRMSRILAGV